MIGDLLVNAAATQEQLREHFDDLRLQESLRGWIIRKAEHRLPKYGPAVLYGAVAVRSFLTDLRRA